MKRFLHIITLVLCLALLAGCKSTKTDVTQPETTLPSVTQTCQVDFMVFGRAVSSQEVVAGEQPYEVYLELDGITMFGWVDEDGNRAEPFATAVLKDTVYTALVYPTLHTHKPFLFADGNNCLRPDDDLLRSEMYDAVNAIVDPETKNYVPANTASTDSPVTGAQLAEFLYTFFPEQMVQSAVDVQAKSVTRAEFAVCLLKLLNFDPAETLTAAETVVIPADISDREDAAYLMEASVAHTVDADGTTWENLGLKIYEPGFVNIDGWLYYVNEDNTFLCGDSVNGFPFDKDGRYTSTDVELDAIVAGILKTIIEENPDAERIDLLYKAYEYVRDNFAYIGRNNHKPIGETDWGAAEAKVMLTEGRGNCYNYAAAFWALARGLGYDARVMSGVVLKDRQDHGWVFLDVDGQRYLCDPEWEMVYRYEREDFTKDMFMLTMGEIGWWNYDWTP